MKEKEFQSKPLLTKREREVFELLVQDKTTKEIASELFISEKTVRNHILLPLSHLLWPLVLKQPIQAAQILLFLSPVLHGAPLSR
ncbi:LuxR C-terminal-related transcriptional regulator [Bacillus subtilis]|uniref:LuxR C-terminal-related transcriptional regulator n=1 Tax=Bacillus subtilis TaxID=1423 RepID=UPI0039A78529